MIRYLGEGEPPAAGMALIERTVPVLDEHPSTTHHPTTSEGVVGAHGPGSRQAVTSGADPEQIVASATTDLSPKAKNWTRFLTGTITNPPVTPVAGAPDCPNPKWTENITDMAFTSATITLFQGANANGTFEAGELVLTVSCTFSSPTTNGSVPSSRFTCTTS